MPDWFLGVLLCRLAQAIVDTNVKPFSVLTGLGRGRALAAAAFLAVCLGISATLALAQEDAWAGLSIN